jgi:hypothetical protein
VLISAGMLTESQWFEKLLAMEWHAMQMQVMQPGAKSNVFWKNNA